MTPDRDMTLNELAIIIAEATVDRWLAEQPFEPGKKELENGPAKEANANNSAASVAKFR